MPYKDVSIWAKTQRAFLRQPLSPDTKALYTTSLKKARQHLKADNPKAVTLAAMRGYEEALGGSENSRHTHVRVLRAFLKWAGNRQVIKWKPRTMQHPKMDRVFLSEVQVEKARQAAASIGTQDALLVSLMVDNSFRVIDCYRMTTARAQALLTQPRAMISSKGRHGGKERPITLHRRTRALLEEYLVLRASWIAGASAPDALFIIKREGWHQMGRKVIANRIARVSRKAGIKFECHDLRASFGHRHYLNGTPLETIALMMGHESVDTTFKAYIGVTADLVRAAQDRLL
jgi:site-specific recombinase XerD